MVVDGGLLALPRPVDSFQISRYLATYHLNRRAIEKKTYYFGAEKNDGGNENPPFMFDEQKIAEIEAMGGDPFFLSDEDEDDDSDAASGEDETENALDGMSGLSSHDQMIFMTASAEASKRFATDGLGPSSSRRQTDDFEKQKESDSADETWEWDGVINEDAHLDLDF